MGLVAIDGFEVEVPDSPGNAAEFGYAGSGANPGEPASTRLTRAATIMLHTLNPRAA